MSDPLYLLWHLGLGDAIVCNGMVRTLADKYGQVIVPCKSHNMSSVKFMFRDDARIVVTRIYSDEAAVALADQYKNVIKLGVHSGKDFDFSKWDRELYRHADVPFEFRWSHFKVIREPDSECPKPSGLYSFVYEDPRRGYFIERTKIWSQFERFESRLMGHVFMMCNPIFGASELHCIDGAVLCLADSFEETRGMKSVCHSYARKSVPPTLRKQWEIL